MSEMIETFIERSPRDAALGQVVSPPALHGRSVPARPEDVIPGMARWHEPLVGLADEAHRGITGHRLPLRHEIRAQLARREEEVRGVDQLADRRLGGMDEAGRAGHL